MLAIVPNEFQVRPRMQLPLNVPKAVASRTAIFQRIKAGVKDGEKTLLTEMLGDNLEDLRSGDLRKAIRRGDKFVSKIMQQVSKGQNAANTAQIRRRGIKRSAEFEEEMGSGFKEERFPGSALTTGTRPVWPAGSRAEASH